MSLIKCENAAFGYDGTIAAENIDLTVNRGDYLYIIGENGSGKSTLIKGLLGLLKPMRGGISYGEGLTSRGIGYMPQKTEIQRDFPASVYEVVISGCLGRSSFRPFYTKEDKNRACEAMTALHIHDIENKSYRDLSGGQQQRVLLARALAATGNILLLDEPAAGLDPVVTAELYGVIDELRERHNIAVIMVSHDLMAIASSATHVLQMKRSPLFYGTRDEYLASDIWRNFSGGKIGGEK